jgi:hypothetical protein
MTWFTRQTIIAAGQVLTGWTHAQIQDFALRHGLEAVVNGYSKADKINGLNAFLLKNPGKTNEEGENLTVTVINALVEEAIRHSTGGYPSTFSYQYFQEYYADLNSGLVRNGFTVEGGQLRRSLPDSIDLPKADDEVHALLKQYGFSTAMGHLDQGIAAHTRGEWAGANAQLRSFAESMFDSIAVHLGGSTCVHPKGGQSRIWLASRSPSFFLSGLNEWTGDGKGFVEGFLRRLHPAGAHPGLSDEEDSTFRLHMVLLMARLMLRRIAQV